MDLSFSSLDSLQRGLITSKYDLITPETVPNIFLFSSSRVPWFHITKQQFMLYNIKRKVNNDIYTLFWFHIIGPLLTCLYFCFDWESVHVCQRCLGNEIRRPIQCQMNNYSHQNCISGKIGLNTRSTWISQ